MFKNCSSSEAHFVIASPFQSIGQLQFLELLLVGWFLPKRSADGEFQAQQEFLACPGLQDAWRHGPNYDKLRNLELKICQ